MKTSEELIHKNLTKNEYDDQELGQPVGLFCFLDEMCVIVCSFCKSAKEFNEVLTLVNHIKSCHSSTADSKIKNEDEFIDENVAECQGVSLSSESNKNLTKQDGYLSSQLFKSETSIYSKSSDLEDSEQIHITKFADENVLIKCDNNFDKGFSAVELHSSQYHCSNCKLNFQLEKELMEHPCSYDASKSVPSVAAIRKKKVFHCDVCSATLSSTRNLRVHLLRHNGERTHKCQYCQNSFFTSTALKNHLVTHTGERNYKCEYCDKTFGTSWYLWKHRKRNHPEQPNKRRIQQINSEDSEEQTTSNGLLKEHISKHKVGRYKCEYENCGKSYTTARYLRSHIRIHTGEKPFKCTFCSLEFYRIDTFKCHMAKHTGERYKCEYENCNRSYSIKAALVSHIRTHTGEKPFKCKSCPRTFHRSCLLKYHMAKHTGERYKCEYKNCDKTYSSKISLRSHIKRHIGENT